MSSEAVESLNDTLNSGVANVTDSLSCSEYSEDAALVGQLAGLSSNSDNASMQWVSDKLSALSTWSSTEQSDDTSWVGADNGAADLYNSDVSMAMTTLTGSYDGAGLIYTETSDAAVLLDAQTTDAADDAATQSYVTAQDNYVNTAAPLTAAYLIAEAAQAAGQGTANTSLYQANMTAASQTLEVGELSAVDTTRTVTAAADAQAALTDSTAYLTGATNQDAAVATYSETESADYQAEADGYAENQDTYADEEANGLAAAIEGAAGEDGTSEAQSEAQAAAAQAVQTVGDQGAEEQLTLATDASRELEETTDAAAQQTLDDQDAATAAAAEMTAAASESASAVAQNAADAQLIAQGVGASDAPNVAGLLSTPAAVSPTPGTFDGYASPGGWGGFSQILYNMTTINGHTTLGTFSPVTPWTCWCPAGSGLDGVNLNSLMIRSQIPAVASSGTSANPQVAATGAALISSAAALNAARQSRGPSGRGREHG